MRGSAHKSSGAADQARKIVDEVVHIARSENASAMVSGGSKPHVTIIKHVTDFNDGYFRSMLSGIEYATRGHFDHGHEFSGYTEWLLRGRAIDVTVRASKEMQ